MKIYSENIEKFIRYKLRLSENDEISENMLNKITDISLSAYKPNLKSAKFDASELSFFKELKSITFNGFRINDEILNNLNQLKNLNYLNLDNCRCLLNKNFESNFYNISISNSDAVFLNKFDEKDSVKILSLKAIRGKVSGEVLKEFINLKSINLLNCDIEELEELKQINGLEKVVLEGCNFKDVSIIEELRKKADVIYGDDEYLEII